ncbi:hypothetical protein HMPREF3156_01790 [Neisseria sp. HMSC06F02]|nr:hypothetical protein HMPREF3156_01790 [Neisseria sp. HMSC06F02]
MSGSGQIIWTGRLKIRKADARIKYLFQSCRCQKKVWKMPD